MVNNVANYTIYWPLQTYNILYVANIHDLAYFVTAPFAAR
jgi:hypothetical protein